MALQNVLSIDGVRHTLCCDTLVPYFLWWMLFAKGPYVRCGSLHFLFYLPSLQTLTRIYAWSLWMWLTCRMHLGRPRWSVMPWSSICELVWIGSLEPWMVLLLFRHQTYFIVLLGQLLFSSIRLMKIFVHLTRQRCYSIDLSLVDLLLRYFISMYLL